MPEDLKHCPFCGHAPKMHIDSWHVPGIKGEQIRVTRYWVRCAKCGASSEEKPSRALAAKLWNTRVGETPQLNLAELLE